MVNKFEHIEEGDRVLVPKEVGLGFFTKTFYCVGIVERTTNTQFIVQGKRYRKANGNTVGGMSLRPAKPYTEEGDQTKEVEDLQRNMKIAFNITQNVDELYKKLSVKRLVDYCNEIELEAIHQKLVQVNDLFIGGQNE